MNVYLYHNLLFGGYFLGAFALVFLFIVCFLCVHVARLIKFGWLYQKKSDTPSPTPTDKKENAPKPQPSAQPVYYIVERKRRTKQSYGEPKEIRFK